MLRNRIYYQFKPFIPRALRAAVRRRVALRLERRVQDVWPIMPGSEQTPPGWQGWPHGKKFALVLTHDVEGPVGLRRCRRLADLESEFGFRSCFNFIPAGEYAVPSELREELTGRGFEIGVHDLHHDGRLYRTWRDFVKKARQINEYLADWKAEGFRSGFMLHKLDWLHQLAIRYDMSTFDTDPFEPQPEGRHTIFPFFISSPYGNQHVQGNGEGYLELPYTLPQDSTLFLLLRHETSEVWIRKLDWIAKHGGMALLDTHPDYMAFQGRPDTSAEYPVERYAELLAYVRDNYSDTCWHALPREVTSYVLDLRNKQLLNEAGPPLDVNGSVLQPTAVVGKAARAGVAAKRDRSLQGKRVGVLLFSNYPADPRPRRAAEALIREGAVVDLLCLQQNEREPRHENVNGVNVSRLPFRRYRGGKLAYVGQYSAFIFVSFVYLTLRSLRRRYDFIHVHNMPDALIFAAATAKARGSKLILDLHDPMPELMQTIFRLPAESWSVRALKTIEKKSIAFSDLVLTVNIACQDLYSGRSCSRDKIRVVLNSPDDYIFRFQPVSLNGSNGQTAAKPFTILYHGSLVARNGLDLAVEALDSVRKSIPNVKLVICGDRTPFLESVLEMVRERRLENCIDYLGVQNLNGIVNAINACDLGIIPNHKNIFTEINTPTRIFEYLALGKPVIAPRTKAIQDYFGDRELVFFELGNANDLARQIEHAYSHREEVAQTTQRGQQVYLDHTWTRERSQFLDAVTGLLQVQRRQ
jgi:glycosyltransferase involved in cell wall biosynthesis